MAMTLPGTEPGEAQRHLGRQQGRPRAAEAGKAAGALQAAAAGQAAAGSGRTYLDAEAPATAVVRPGPTSGPAWWIMS